MVMKFPFEVKKMLQNRMVLVVSRVNVLNATESFLKLLILCYVNCTTVKKKKYQLIASHEAKLLIQLMSPFNHIYLSPYYAQYCR